MDDLRKTPAQPLYQPSTQSRDKAHAQPNLEVLNAHHSALSGRLNPRRHSFNPSEVFFLDAPRDTETARQTTLRDVLLDLPHHREA